MAKRVQQRKNQRRGLCELVGIEKKTTTIRRRRGKVARRSKFPATPPSSPPSTPYHVPVDYEPSSTPSPSPLALPSPSTPLPRCWLSRTLASPSPPPPGFPFPIYRNCNNGFFKATASESEEGEPSSPYHISDDADGDEDEPLTPYHVPDDDDEPSTPPPPGFPFPIYRRSRTPSPSSPLVPPGFPFPIYRPSIRILGSDDDGDSATSPVYYDCPPSSSSPVSSSLPSPTPKLRPPPAGCCHGYTTANSSSCFPLRVLLDCSQRLLLS